MWNVFIIIKKKILFFYFVKQPFKPEFSDLDYADVDYRSYGPINYKAASIALLQANNNRQPQDKLPPYRERMPRMYGESDDDLL